MAKSEKLNVNHLSEHCKGLNSVVVLGALQLFPANAWIKNNLPLMKSFVNDPESYGVRSLLLSAEEIAVGFLSKDSEMPIVLFNQLKLKGDSIITNPPAK